jgi:hypothetical protein
LTLSGVDVGLQRLVSCIQPLIRLGGFSLYALDNSECGGFIAARPEARSKHLGFSRKRSYRGEHRSRKNYSSHDMTSRKAFSARRQSAPLRSTATGDRGQVDDPVLEAICRLWWRAHYRICYCISLIRMSVHDPDVWTRTIHTADPMRESDRERLVRASPVTAVRYHPFRLHPSKRPHPVTSND